MPKNLKKTTTTRQTKTAQAVKTRGKSPSTKAKNTLKQPTVAVIMGSSSDLKIMQPAIKLLRKCQVSTEVKIVSAHRTPDFMRKYAKEAKSRGIQLIIAGAGGAAHLPGMTACFTTLPVVGVPISLKYIRGLDSLLSTVQMPKGVPVATVAINNSSNAALLALRMLALKNPALDKQLKQFQEEQKAKSLRANHLLDFL